MLLNFLVLLTVFLPAQISRAADLPVLTMTPNCSSADIQSALDSLTNGGEVVLPPGDYEVRQPIVLSRNHQTLRGSGLTTRLFLASRANCPVIILGAPFVNPSRCTAMLRLADLQIDGNRANQQMEFWRSAIDGSQLNNNGVDVWNVTDTQVEHVVCSHCRSGGLVTAKVRGLTVRDFTAFDSQFDGLACYQTENSRFMQLFLHDNLSAGISLDLAFNHNEISGARLTENDLGIFMRYSHDNVFREVTIRRSHKYGVFMAQTSRHTTSGWQLLPGTECTGNSFPGLQITNDGLKPFLVNNDSCTNNFVPDYRITETPKPGLFQADVGLISVR